MYLMRISDRTISHKAVNIQSESASRRGEEPEEDVRSASSPKSPDILEKRQNFAEIFRQDIRPLNPLAYIRQKGPAGYKSRLSCSSLQHICVRIDHEHGYLAFR